jgi:ABC-2 type transport system permease protein
MRGPFAPGSLLWLLGFEIKLYWRGLFGTKGENPWPRVALIGFLLVLGAGAGFVGASVLSTLAPVENPSTASLILASFFLAAPASLMISQATGSVINVVYTRGDLPLLFSSPISPWAVTMSRALGVVINVCLLYLALLIFVMAWAPFVGAGAWFGLIPTVLALGMAATAFGMLLALGLMRLVGPKHARTVSQVMAGLFGAGIFIAFQSFNFLPDEREEVVIRSVIAWVRSVDTPAWNPALLPARAALGPPLAQGAWFGLALSFFACATFLFSRVLPRFVASIESIGAAKPKTKTGAKAFRSGVMANLLYKEWRLLRRDPLLLFQISLQLAYLFPLVLVMLTNISFRPDNAGPANAVFSSFCVLLLSSLGGNLAWLTASAEDAPDLIGGCPVGRGTVEAAKFFAAFVPVAALGLIPAGVFAMTSPFIGVVVFLCGAGAAASAALLGVWYQKPGNRREFRQKRQTSWTAAFGQAILAFSWSAVAGLIIGGLALWAAIPAILIAITLFVLEDGRPKGARDIGGARQVAVSR